MHFRALFCSFVSFRVVFCALILLLPLPVGVELVVADPPTETAKTGVDGRSLRRIDPPIEANFAEASNLTVRGEVVYLTWIESKTLDKSTGIGDSAHANARFSRKSQERAPARLFRLRFAKWRAKDGWSRARTIEQSTQIVSNWADFPSMAVLENGTMLCAFPERSGGAVPFAYDVVVKASYDNGETWTRIGRPHGDLTATEHGFCSIVPASEGEGIDRALLFWLDGRAMAPIDAGGRGEDGEMSIRSAWYRDERIDSQKVLDRRTCECCTTDAVMGKDGPIVVYRDRDYDEVRDISIVRFEGGKWTKPSLVHADGWMMPGCPVNGPAVDAVGSEVAVAWFTAANDESAIKVAFSHDGGRHFDDPIVVDRGAGRLGPIGRVDVVLVPAANLKSHGEMDAIISWVDVAEEEEPIAQVMNENEDWDAGGAVIRVCRVRSTDGSIVGEQRVVAVTSPARSSGFPVMVRVGGGSIFFSWTDVGGGGSHESAVIRAAVLDGIE